MVANGEGGGKDDNDDGNSGWSKLYTFSTAYGNVASKLIENEGLSTNTYHAIVNSMEDPPLSWWWLWGGGQRGERRVSH